MGFAKYILYSLAVFLSLVAELGYWSLSDLLPTLYPLPAHLFQFLSPRSGHLYSHMKYILLK